jgi:ribosomal protein S18 acetylase RimI-like enzyme
MADDVPAIVRLLADDALGATREVPGAVVDERYVAAFAAIDADPNQSLIVLEDVGSVVGCLQLTFIPGLSLHGGWRGQVEGVRVASSHRGQGLGQIMMNWVIAESRRRGCTLVQLTTNKVRVDALRFYRSLGFVESHAGLKLDLSA